ncbi:PBP1 and LysM peptidoglycan-binding domain-containing protein [Capnocytophaga gingivalis]|jgi:lysM domain protein|uniref:PBP1 and LysM peptidoglycan-binding domain-containing protein n=1 Tax=Capnocytophaga gingivalis TaxID=1017 RepID=UPI000F265C0A|nr:LysM peptidoglycan-binding domain-containing protein [Capnocytophaga gingivalis]RKW06237.1 MAG: LysM peptidoglycan-binding domain-containing protein [Capnocytophaga sp.]
MRKILLFLCVLTGFSLWAQPKQHNSYTVKEGDTLESIAKVFRVSPSDIKSLNPTLEKGLQKGMLLIIPGDEISYFNKKQPTGFEKYTVKDKETLYGLAQRFHITQDDLRRYNMILYKKELRKGQEITIPLYRDAPKEISKGKEGLTKYIVKPGEGLWRIAQNYGVTQETLERLNPNLPNPLKEGMEIWVPAGKSGVPEVTTDKALVLYQVEKGEGFMSLERKFGLSQKELEKLNPELKDGIKLEAQIWIPKNNFLDYVATLGGASQTDVATGNATDANPKIKSGMNPSNIKTVSFVLPFRVNGIQAGNIADIKIKLQKEKITAIASDFYSGALMALDSLQKMGFSLTVNVYDSNGNAQGVKAISSSEGLKNSQVIIGPFSPSAFNALSETITSDNIAILAPLSNRNIELRPNVFQTVPTIEVQQNSMISFINQKYPDANIVLLSDAKSKDMNEKLLSSFSQAKNVDNIQGIQSALNKEATNIVFVSSDDVVFLSDAIRILYNIAGINGKNKNYNIIMATLDKGDAYDHNSISNSQLSALKFTYPAANRYAGESNPFIKKYLKTYKISPSKYAFRGFDLTMDAVLRTSLVGNFIKEANIGETSYQENKFQYVKNAAKGGGYENRAVYILRYEDLQISEIY